MCPKNSSVTWNKFISFVIVLMGCMDGGERLMKVAIACLLLKQVYGGWEGGVL